MSDAPPLPQKPFVASDGVVLAIHRVLPASRVIRGTILSLHGIQSHFGWYGRSSRKLADAGWEVWFMDRRGSGVSAGRRGHAPHWERLVNDVVQVLRELRARHAGPVILQAVSWGGKLAAAVARLHPELIDGLALLYPGIYARIRPGLQQRCLLKLADLLGVRLRTVLIPLDDPSLFTSDPDSQKFLSEDPLSLRTATSGFFIADQALSRLAQTSGPHLNMPTLVALAGCDRIIDNAATRQFFQSIAASDKTLIEFPDAAHTLEFDACFDEFLAAYIQWLDCQRKSPAVATPGL